MDNYIHARMWDEITYPFQQFQQLQQLYRWISWMDEKIGRIFYWACDYD